MSSTPTTDEPTITEIDWTDHYDQGVDSSLYDATYTYSNDKYSCVQGFYFAHLVFNWFVFLSGVACLITRLVPARFKYLHSWFGRIYILSMLWSTTTSLLMNNTGLPLSTLISFAAVMGCLSVGWIVIIFHKQGIEKAAQSIVQQKLLESAKSTDEINLGEMMGEAKMEVVDSKTFQNLCSTILFAQGSSWDPVLCLVDADRRPNFQQQSVGRLYVPHVSGIQANRRTASS